MISARVPFYEQSYGRSWDQIILVSWGGLRGEASWVILGANGRLRLQRSLRPMIRHG